MSNRTRPVNGRDGDDHRKSGQDSQDLRAATHEIQQPPRRDPRNGQIKYFLFWVTEMKGRMATMSPAARGAYVSLLIEYMAIQGPLPDDDKRNCRITGTARKDWPDIRGELLDAFDVSDGMLTDAYADRCLAEFKAASARGKANARKRVYVAEVLRDVKS